jgi:hypothetical protein
LQEVLAFYGVGFAVMFDHRSVGQIRYPRLMSCKALGMEFPVEVINLAPADKVLGIRPAAKETGAMACSQSGDLIKKEQRGVAFSHGLVLHVLVMYVAANPVLAGPAAVAQGFVIAVKLAAAVAHYGAAFWNSYNLTPWRDAVLQRHG